MGEIKWIKIMTGIFDNRKIRQIEIMPEGDTIIVIWFKLLCLAGTVNDCGMVYVTPEVPYNEQMLAAQFNRPLATVQLALSVLQRFEMIEIVDDVLHVSNWERYQNVEGMDKIREQNRARKQLQREREKQKLLEVSENEKQMSRDSHVTVTQQNKNKSKKENINTSCSEPSFGSSEPEAAPADPKPKKERKPAEPEEPEVITLQLNDGSEHGISQRQVDDFQALYPAVDVMQALRDMKGWCLSNPTKRKTKSGIMRFVNSWLSREQNRPAAGNNYQQQKQTGGIKNGFDVSFYGYGDY